MAVGGSLPGFESYEEVIAAYDGSDIDDPVLGTQMLYTSGTTGRPKGVHRSSGGAPSALAAVNLCGYDEDFAHSVDAHLCTGPLYHAAPLAFSVALPLLYGVPIVIMEQWDPAETLRLVEQHGVTHTHMVPTMFHRLLALPDEVRAKYDLSSLRFVIHGAAPCPVTVKQQLIEWLGPIVVEYYAATEGVGTLVDSPTWLAHPGTVGRPMVPELVKVADENGAALAAGRGRVGVPAHPGRRPDSTTTATPTRPPTPTGGTISPSATWATWMPRATLPDRPLGQPHHLRRGEHLSGRDRRRPAPAPSRGRRGDHRGA